jgi:hypothetical protein
VKDKKNVVAEWPDKTRTTVVDITTDELDTMLETEGTKKGGGGGKWCGQCVIDGEENRVSVQAACSGTAWMLRVGRKTMCQTMYETAMQDEARKALEKLGQEMCDGKVTVAGAKARRDDIIKEVEESIGKNIMKQAASASSASADKKAKKGKNKDDDKDGGEAAKVPKKGKKQDKPGEEDKTTQREANGNKRKAPQDPSERKGKAARGGPDPDQEPDSMDEMMVLEVR